MKIVIQSRIQTIEEKNLSEDGEILTVDQAQFETISQAKTYLDNAQQKYGHIKHQDYFSPEQGSGAYYTEAVPNDIKFVTYWYYLDGFEGNLLNMLTNTIKSAKQISLRDIRAGIDYDKVADRDALALENLAKRLHEYLTSGRKNPELLNTLSNQIKDLSMDLEEVVNAINLHDSSESGLAGLAAGAVQKTRGLRKTAGALKRAIEDVQQEMTEAEGRDVTFEEAEIELNNRIEKANIRNLGRND